MNVNEIEDLIKYFCDTIETSVPQSKEDRNSILERMIAVGFISSEAAESYIKEN